MTRQGVAEPRPGAGAVAWLKAAGPPLILVILLQAAYGLSVAHTIADLDPLRVALTLALFLFDAIGRRLVNDYEDYARGLDKPGGVRPDSSLALGMDMRRVRVVGLVSFALAWVLAVYLAVTTNPWILLLVAVCYVGYFLYAGGPRPLGHRGLGEVIDFLITGTAVTVLVIWVNAGGLDATSIIAALGPGFLFTALMLHNNARDVDKDAAAGKRTLPHKIGLTGTKILYVVAVSGFYVVVVVVAALLNSLWVLLPVLTLPWSVALMWQVGTASRLGDSLVSWARLYLVMIASFALFSVGAWL
jgi:1,4-dihydroxy-2-naphthoate octaprenyltransferase